MIPCEKYSCNLSKVDVIKEKKKQKTNIFKIKLTSLFFKQYYNIVIVTKYVKLKYFKKN